MDFSAPLLTSLAPQVWFYSAHPDPEMVQPTIGVIRTAQQTILIDAGNSPRYARRILADLYAQDFPPVRTLIYTHHHWDHVLGSASYHPTRVIAHDLCAAHLKAWTQRHWTASALREEMQQTPRWTARNQAMIDVLEDWRELRVATPNLIFSDEMTLYEEDITITLRHVGGRHADDSIIVQTSTGVLFVGDSYYGNQDDASIDMTMLQSFLAYDCSIVVDGHSPPSSPDEIRQLLGGQ
jgi:glyoxylase-like metal-dependent hydrolase (beta-lactamase superfamily II)